MHLDFSTTFILGEIQHMVHAQGILGIDYSLWAHLHYATRIYYFYIYKSQIIILNLGSPTISEYLLSNACSGTAGPYSIKRIFQKFPKLSY